MPLEGLEWTLIQNLNREFFTIDNIFNESYCSILEILETSEADIKSFGLTKVKKILNKFSYSGYQNLIKWKNN